MLNASVAFADRKDHRQDKGRYEHRDSRDHKNHGPKIHNNYDHHKKFDREREKRHQNYIKQQRNYYKHQVRMSRHYHRDFERNFWRMVAQAAYGGTNVNVWQISNDCYMVRFLLNGHYYTRPIYPYSNSYGSRSLISVNWRPANSWINIPLININL